VLGACFIAEGPLSKNTAQRNKPKLLPKELRHSDMLQDEGLHRLKEEKTNQYIIVCVVFIDICRGHECNFDLAASRAY
jgi:hypothetical protein